MGRRLRNVLTVGILAGSLYQAVLAHLALAWPYGRKYSEVLWQVAGAYYSSR